MYIIHLVRKISPTSMPWNDLYYTQRKLRMRPGICIEIGLNRTKILRDNDKKKYFIRTNIFLALLILIRLSFREKSRNNQVLFHVHNNSLIPFAIILKPIVSAIVINIHNSLQNYSLHQYLLLKFFIKFFDKIISVSNSVKLEVNERWKNISSKSVYILNGIDVKTLERVNDLHNLQHQKINDVIIIARLVPQKNPERIIKVLAQTKKVKSIVWFGDGYLSDSIKKEASDKLKNKNIQFMGIAPRDTILSAINQSKIYLALSRWEGVGVANIEALSLPTNVLLSDIAPHRELHDQSDFTLLDLSMKNSEIASVIDSHIDLSLENQKFLRNRAIKARMNFDLEKKVKQYEEMYFDLTKIRNII